MLAVISAAVVILTAGYILWTIQRVYLGPEYKGPHAEALRPMTSREIAIAAPLVVMAVVLGIFPKTLLNYTDATINGLVSRLNPARQSAEFTPLGMTAVRTADRETASEGAIVPAASDSRRRRNSISAHHLARHDPRCQGVAVNLHELIEYVLNDLGRRSVRYGRS